MIETINCGCFCGIKPSYSWEESDIVIVPIPYEGSTSYMAGTKFAPDAINSASAFMEYYDMETGYELTENKRIYTVEAPALTKNSMKEAMDGIYGYIKPFVNSGKFIVSLGGEHSITPPLVKAMTEKYDNLSVLHFDAHGDLRDSYEGTSFSHACAMRRTREICPVVQLGIRSISSEENKYIESAKIGDSIHYAKDFNSWNIDAIIASLSDNVYISFDFDGLDPSIMPAVGTPEPGGLLWYDTLAILKKCFEKKNVIGCDFVELMPSPPMFHADFLAASLVYKILTYKFALSTSQKR